MHVVPPDFTALRGLPCSGEGVDEFIGTPPPAVLPVIARTRGPFLVLGAGGKMGLHLCIMLRRALERLGRADRVIAVSRFGNLRGCAAFEERSIETHRCDLGDPAALAGLPDAPTVFFLAGVKFGTAGSPDLLHAINVEIPRRVAERYAGSRIVAFSSGCVYPFVTPASGGASEATPPAAVGDYAASCIARERAFTDTAAVHGTPVVLVRLNYSNEFRYGLLVDIAEAVLQGRPIDVTTGHVNVIWQTDAVAHSLQALDLAGAPAVPINIAGRDILSVRELARRFGLALNREPQIAGTESDTAWLNNAARSHQLFGAPPTSVEQMIAWVAAWLQSGGETWGKPTRFERRDGRF
jgi:nucleoside-diphosphate-sugar epimerase